MRILAVSDLHYRLPHYDWLVRASSEADVVALCGDLADVVNPVPIDVQSVVLGKYLTALSSEALVLASSGNHDLDGPGAHGEQVAGWLRRVTDEGVHTDGASIDVDDVRFTICPWWDGPVTREEVGAQLAAAAVDRPATWIWLYHAPPAGTPLCKDGRREFPDHDLAAWIEQYQPDVVFCGHIHQAPWVLRWLVELRQLRPDLGVQPRQADRPDPAEHHARHERADRPLVRRLRVRDDQPRLRLSGLSTPGRARNRSSSGRSGGAPGCRGSGRPSRGAR